MIYLVLYFIPWIVGIIYYYSTSKRKPIIYIFTLCHLVIGIGIFGIWNFIAHTLNSEFVANQIGWVSNGFQKELGWVSLGIGICGILCYWIRDNFWIATVIPFTTFLFGASIVHIIDILSKGNLNPGNTIIILPDIIGPATIIILLILNKKLVKVY